MDMPVDKRKRPNACKHWCFTLNNYTENDIGSIVSEVPVHCYRWRVQSEIGHEKETPHLQGYISLKNKGRPMETFKWGNNWESARNPKAAELYCWKEDTRDNKFVFDSNPPDIIDVRTPTAQWELDILALIDTKPDYRTLHWFWEPNGNFGKTSLQKYIFVKIKRVAFIEGGKGTDIKCSVILYHQKNNYYPKTILYNITRSTSEYINYSAIESLKDGLLFSGKYESCAAVFNCPHVLIFANEPPDTSKVSIDRWVITRLNPPEDTMNHLESLYL